VNGKFDKSALKRIEEIQHLEEVKKKTLFDVIDTFIRNQKEEKLSSIKKARNLPAFKIIS
jgi:hypothetical protein